MRIAFAVMVVAVSSSAVADPGGVPPPYAYRPVLDADEQELLSRGELDPAGGAVIEFFLGFGLGQASQHRWGETGWIFALGDLGSTYATFRGMAMCLPMGGSSLGDTGCRKGEQWMLGGAIAMFAFHVAGAVEAAVAAHSHNARVRVLRARVRGGGLALQF